SDSGTLAITVDAVNDAPANSVPGAQSVNEDTALVFSAGNGNLISVSDVDAGSGALRVTLAAGNGTLTLSGTSGLTFSNGSGAGDALMSFTGTLSAINAALAGMSFLGNADYNGPGSVQITVNDQGNSGQGAALSSTSAVSITVNAINDPPVISAPSAASMFENSNLRFRTSNGNAIVIDDVDAGSASLSVTLTATHGLLTLWDTSGLTFSAGDGSNDAAMTFSGALTDINAALDGLKFNPTGGYFGPASIALTVNDLGSSGSGGAQR